MPEACPSIRSTARCVLPVLVGPRTAMSREASPRAGERFMSMNVADVAAPCKPKRLFKFAPYLSGCHFSLTIPPAAALALANRRRQR
jgi:hypothetical protein